MDISRRRVGQWLGGAATAGLAARAARAAAPPDAGPVLTAAQVVDRIWARLAGEGVSRALNTVDTFKAGDPDTPVNGIAVTFMSTWEVLKRADAAGLNFLITHEPTFWSHQELPAVYDNLDHALYDQMRAWIASRKMIVWRIHDHWHRRRPEPMSVAQDNRLGWGSLGLQVGHTVSVLPTPLADLARQVQTRFNTRNVRVIGDPAMMVRTVVRGGHGASENLAAVLTGDVLLVNEGREFDTFEFVRDCNDLGVPRGAIVISHEQGEEFGMQLAEPWVQSIVPERPVRYLGTGEAFWAP